MAEKEGTLRDGDQQFGSWLRVNTPNLATKKKKEKRIVWVAGYKEEVSGDTKTNSSHERGDAVDHAGMWIGSDSIEGEA